MGWEIEFTDEWGEWYWSLTEEQQDAVVARLEMLEDQGPTLGRPTAAEIDGSKVPHLKELRCSKDGALRILFVFDPRRCAVLLVGGDKTGRWKDWYREAIPEAERLYEVLLEELREEGEIS